MSQAIDVGMAAPCDVTMPAPTQDSKVAGTHSARVVIKSTNVSDFNQNKRTKSQYPEEPDAEASAKTRMILAESPSALGKGIHAASNNASMDATAHRTVARATNAILDGAGVPRRSDIASDVA
jgi:hypothetical protein